jgi:ribosomal protein L12E/L44/L45/RPP1/RPP2
LAAAENNQTNHQQQSDQQESSDNNEHNGSCASASQSAKTTATNVIDDFQPPLSQLLLDSDGVQQSSQSRKISNRSNSSSVSHHSHSENSQNGNSDSGDHQVTAGASNGTDSAEVTSTAMDWTHDNNDADQLPVSPSLVNRRKKATTTTTPLAVTDVTTTATADSNPLVFPLQDEPWGGDKEPEAPEVSVMPTPSRTVVNDVLIESGDDDIGSDKEEEDPDDGCMGEQDSPPVSPPSSSSPTSRSSSVASVSVASLSRAASCSPTTGGDGQEHYCLRWTNHGSHVLGVFVQLLRDESLVDVTLSAEGRSVRAHKMVLSACSSFFRTLFVQHADQRHPIIILKDTKFEELQSLIQFMYKGEVSVEYGQLATLLKSAENLRVKGLAEVVNSATAAVAAAAAAKNKQQQATTSTTAGAANNNDGDEDEMDEKLDPIFIERTRLLGAPSSSAREPPVDHQRNSRLHHRRLLHPYSSGNGRRRTLHPQTQRASTPPTNHRRGMTLVVDSPLLVSTDDQHHPAEDLSSAHRQRLNRDWTAQPQTPPHRDGEAGATAPLLLVGEASQHSHRHRHSQHKNLTKLSSHHSAQQQQLHRQSLNSATASLDASPDAVDIALLGSGRHHNPDDNDHNHRFKTDASSRNSTPSVANATITQPTTTAMTTTTADGEDVKEMLTSPPPLAHINDTTAIAQDLRQRSTSSVGSFSPPLGSASAKQLHSQSASNQRFSHPWMMEEESEEESADGCMDADEEVEDEDEEGEEDEAYRHQRRTLKPLNHSSGRRPWSSSSPSVATRHSVGSPQHHPMVEQKNKNKSILLFLFSA